ncbi:MAG: SPOCS domain-containing protein [Sarcina sp.]
MAKILRDLIEYNNINQTCLENIENFKQTNLDCVFCIPVKKPNIEQITKVWVDTCIKCEKLVKTPVGISLEGQRVTGYKYLIEGSMYLKIEYVALDNEQSLHTADTEVPFCSYVVLPENFNKNALITPNILIEDINSTQMDSRCIYNNITFISIVDIC